MRTEPETKTSGRLTAHAVGGVTVWRFNVRYVHVHHLGLGIQLSLGLVLGLELGLGSGLVSSRGLCRAYSAIRRG